MNNFNELHQHFSSILKEEIEVIKSREPQNLYQPVIYTLNMGGKRLRPILLLMACELYDTPKENAYSAAIAIEMFHNFTLLHDDIMDNADLRRNSATVHNKYSNNTAILSGDAMSILSYEYLTQCQSDNYREIFELFTQTALKICEGQQFDMDFETLNNISVDKYLKMIGLKTAILIAASLKMGALIGNAPAKDANLLYHFGYNLGMAFQLQDDHLDTYGDPDSFGKNIGGDILANKKTFLLINALENAKGKEKEDLVHLTSSTNFPKEEKITKVKNIYNHLGVVQLSKDKMEFYYKKAIECWSQIEIEEDKKSKLITVANKMMQRKR